MFQEYIHLAVGGLLLDQRVYDEQRAAANGLRRGLVLVLLVAFMVAIAALIGRLGASLASPPLDRIQATVLAGLMELPFYQRIVETDPNFSTQFHTMYNQYWQIFSTLDSGNVGAGLVNLFVGPLQSLLGWLLFGLFAHLMARALGGRGTLGQTLSCTALAAGANLLTLVALIPFAQVAGVTLLWLLASYVGVRTAHQLDPWRSFWATLLGPLVLVLLFSCAACALFFTFGSALGKV